MWHGEFEEYDRILFTLQLGISSQEHDIFVEKFSLT